MIETKRGHVDAFKSAGRVADVLHKDIVVEVGARTGKERGSVRRGRVNQLIACVYS